MKKILVAVVAAGLIGVSSLWAKNVAYEACTADAHIVVLAAVFDDTALAQHPEIEEHIGMVFVRVAQSMTAEDLIGLQGFRAFANALTDEEKATMASPARPRVMEGSCRVAGGIKV